MMQKAPNQTDRTSGPCQEVYAKPAQLGDTCAPSDPSREMVRLSPNARLSSLPLNQRAIAVVTATISDSAPRPNSRRPAAMTATTGGTPLTSNTHPKTSSSAFTPIPSGARAGVSGHAVTAAPTKQMTPNSIVDFFVPIRSMMIPPMSTITMFGKL